MVIGIDISIKMTGKNKRIIISLVCTIDKNFSKYWSTCKTLDDIK
jgi:hypothetical protein